MPIKSFTFAFRLDAKDLLAYVVEKNVQVDIQATGSKRQAEPEVQSLPATQPMLALPAPHPIAGERKSPDGRLGSKAVVLFYLAQHGRATTSQLKAALVEAKYRASTYNGLMWSLKKDGLVSQSAQGYRILNKGLKKLDDVAEGNE
jgi:hypothetical protein